MIQITIHNELLLRLDQIPKKLRSVLDSKFRALIDEVYAKAVAQFPTTKDEVEHGVDTQGSLLIGYIEPATAKAGAIEFGGKGWYEIFPVKARLLRFIGSKDGRLVFAPGVFHPPMRGKHYIRDTILANVEHVEEELTNALDGTKL